MRHRGVRLVFVGLVLMFPLMMSAVSPRPLGRALRADSAVWPSEALLVGGLVVAGRQRHRLRAESAAATARPARRAVPTRPHAGVARAVATANAAHALRRG